MGDQVDKKGSWNWVKDSPPYILGALAFGAYFLGVEHGRERNADEIALLERQIEFVEDLKEVDKQALEGQIADLERAIDSKDSQLVAEFAGLSDRHAEVTQRFERVCLNIRRFTDESNQSFATNKIRRDSRSIEWFRNVYDDCR